MQTFTRKIHRGWLGLPAVLIIAACGSSSMPGAADSPGATTATSATAQPEQLASMVVRGVVLDPANQPVASAEVECMGGDLTCTRTQTQLTQQDGPDPGIRTDANGAYEMVITARSAAASSADVLMNSSAPRYEVAWQTVRFPDRACTSDRAGCALRVDFSLRHTVDH